MKKIYVILMHTNTNPSKFIRFMTKYEYSHVAIALDRGCNVLYSFGRKKLHSIINAGFTIEHKNGEFFRTFNKTKCKIYEIEINDNQYDDVKNILNDMKSNISIYKYDFLGIVVRFFNIPLKFKNRYVCSYFVASILQRTNICNFNKEVCLIKPQDFENLKELSEIYKGKYSSYNL